MTAASIGRKLPLAAVAALAFAIPSVAQATTVRCGETVHKDVILKSNLDCSAGGTGGGAVDVVGNHTTAIFGFRFERRLGACIVDFEVAGEDFVFGFVFGRPNSVVEAVARTRFGDVFLESRLADVLEVNGRRLALGDDFRIEGRFGVAEWICLAGFGKEKRAGSASYSESKPVAVSQSEKARG